MAEQGSGQQGREPAGTVAEETARLLEALGGWADGLRAHDDGTRASTGEQRGNSDQQRGTGEQQRGAGEEPAGTRHTGRCEHCGATSRAGEALTCQLCPVCQGIALLRTVRPETVERLADLAAALSGALRDVAADRFGPPPPPPQSPPPRGHRVQDITVDDEDETGTAPTTDRPRRTQEKTAP